MTNIVEYAKGVSCWETRMLLSQDSNTVDGGEGEELEVTVYGVPVGPNTMDKFVVFKTDQWAIDPQDIDKFCAFLKEICK
jgi:hypothetical protein